VPSCYSPGTSASAIVSRPAFIYILPLVVDSRLTALDHLSPQSSQDVV
jgi:hypothetical protein